MRLLIPYLALTVGLALAGYGAACALLLALLGGAMVLTMPRRS